MAKDNARQGDKRNAGAEASDPAAAENSPKLAYTIPELCAATGISRAMVYKEIRAERLKVKKIGARTLIPIDEAKAWMKI
ncbi:MAG: helix-turn-helix domain-containing protein [Bacteroidota bacterium]